MSAPDAVADLRRLLDAASRTVPGLRARIACASSPLRPWWSVQPERLAALRRHGLQSHARAGVRYVSMQCWGQLVWRPIYLAVIAVHLCERSPRLSHLAQTVAPDDAPGEVSGCSFALHDQLEGGEAARRASSASALAQGCARLYGAWSALDPLPAHAAVGAQADCVLAALLAVQRQRPEWRPADLVEHASRWLAEMRSSARSGFVSWRTRSGEERLALQRSVCCLHYRRADGERCESCPGRPWAERRARLQAAS